MPDILVKYQSEIIDAICETFYMVGVSMLAAIIIGLPLGTFLYLTRIGSIRENRVFYGLLNLIVNVIRSFPFLLLVVFLIPFTRMVVGTAIGTTAATVPMAVIAIAHYARLAEQSFVDVPRGVIEAGIAMGATIPQLIWRFLFVEARAGLVLGLTTSIISFISYSTIMGIVGGGGIGDFAIRYGYQQYKTDLMGYVIIIMVILVMLIQFLGNSLARLIDKR